MGILDQVTEMRRQGISQEEMTAKLQEQGVSPRAINDAFNQEKIKSAVSAEEVPMRGSGVQGQPAPGTFYQPLTQEQQMPAMQEQVPGLPGDPQAYQDPYAQPQNPYAQQPVYQQDPYAQQAPPPQAQEEYYPDQGRNPQDPYAQDGAYQDEYPQAPAYNTDTIIEISEQVFSEKIKKMEKQVEQFTEFAALAQTKISNNNERVKRMESLIDKLQIAILEKVGSYGKDIQTIKKEMEMIEDSFTKVIPELHKRKTSHSTQKTSHKK